MEENREDFLAACLASKRESHTGTPGFEDRVMEAIAQSAQSRSSDPGRRPTQAGTWDRPWWRRAVDVFTMPPRRFFWAPAALALLVIGTILTFRPLPGHDGAGLPGGETTRIKGEDLAFALLTRQDDSSYRRIADGAILRGGDRIQALYWLADSAHVELLSLDQGGKAECYTCALEPAPKGPAAGRPLPFGLELEPGEGADLFVLAASEERLAEAAHRARLQAAWKAADGDLSKAAASLSRDGGPARYRTLLVRRGGRT